MGDEEDADCTCDCVGSALGAGTGAGFGAVEAVELTAGLTVNIEGPGGGLSS